MSSVNSASDRSSQEDGVRSARDTYKKDEAESAKRNAAKLKAMTEAHAAEVQELQQEHTKEIGEMQERTKETVSRRDMQHQKEIEGLRDMHMKQVQRAAAEAELRANETVPLKAELNRVVETNDAQKKTMEKNFEGHIHEADQQLETYAVTARDKQKEAQENTKKSMNQAHEKVTSALIKDRDQRVSELKNENQLTRTTKDQLIGHLKNEKDMQAERLSSEFEENIKTARSDNSAAQSNMRDRLTDEIKRNGQLYGKATAAYRDDQLQSRERLERSVHDREEARIRSLEFANKNLKDDEPRIRETMQRQKSIELNDQRHALSEEIFRAEDSRKDVVAAANENVKNNISRMVDQNNKQIGDTHKFYKDRMSMNDLKADERVQTVQLESDRALSHEKNISGERFERVKNFSNLEQAKQRTYFERATAGMKDNFDDRLREVREQNKKEQDALLMTFAKQGQETDAKFQEKLSQLGLKYEAKMAEMQDAHAKELTEQANSAEKQKKEIEKKAQLDQQSAAVQYENRIAKMAEVRKRDLETMERKHQETLANLTKTRQS